MQVYTCLFINSSPNLADNDSTYKQPFGMFVVKLNVLKATCVNVGQELIHTIITKGKGVGHHVCVY